MHIYKTARTVAREVSEHRGHAEDLTGEDTSFLYIIRLHKGKMLKSVQMRDVDCGAPDPHIAYATRCACTAHRYVRNLLV